MSVLERELINLEEWTFEPLADQTLVRPLYDASDPWEASSLVKPDNLEQGRAQYGRVIAVGPGTMTPDGAVIPLDWGEGDVIGFSPYGGIDYTTHWLIRKQDVLVRLIPCPHD